jgi:flagella basal body P-ring formation protein FlgA
MHGKWGWSVALLLIAPLAARSQPVAIEGRQGVLVQGPEVTIGDVAEVRGDDPETVARVRNIVIGQSPPAGEERTLRGGYITTRLKQHGFRPQDWLLQVPEKIRVTRASQRVASQDIEAAVLRALREQSPWDAQKTTLRELRGIEPVLLPPGPVQYEVTFPANATFLGPTSFSLSLRVAGNIEKRLYGTAHIEVLQEVAMLARPVSQDDVITAEDIQLKHMHRSRVSSRAVTEAEELIGKRVKRPLPAHTMVHTSDVETLPVVQKGDVVLIVIESPALKITATGEALEHGGRGATIRVRNMGSNREIRAVVIDKETVRVPF